MLLQEQHCPRRHGVARDVHRRTSQSDKPYHRLLQDEHLRTACFFWIVGFFDFRAFLKRCAWIRHTISLWAVFQ
ncbi:Uncharacterised protein [Vibrio cholerae]|nr:Uncharacterised protein [Vibrio cholerae]